MIAFPIVEHPEVSVLMVTYGRWDWASRALEALLANTPPVYEVVVVDNASPDDTGDRLEAEVRGIRLIRSPTNLGFGGGNNLAAEAARGDVLCLLNSDALVGPGWYPTMRARLDDRDVGAVVPLFVGEDGAVIEAGVLLGSDGVTLPVGRGLDATDPAVRFPRDVDYGSAAFMLVRADAYRRAGGFSPAYGIGYLEDVDLCLELRAQGLRTVYEPGTTVMHAVGSSSNPALAQELSRRNRVVFLRRWGSALDGRTRLDQPVRYPHRRIHARDHVAPLRVLVVGEALPEPRGAVGRLVALLTPPAPRLRLTLAADDVDETRAAPALAAGVEVLPVEGTAWLRERVAHPIVVALAGPRAASRFGEAIDETQPQAAVIYDMAGPTVDDDAAEVALLRRAAVVLAPTPDHARRAREAAPEARVIVTDPDDPDLDRVLTDVLTSVGIARP